MIAGHDGSARIEGIDRWTHGGAEMSQSFRRWSYVGACLNAMSLAASSTSAAPPELPVIRLGNEEPFVIVEQTPGGPVIRQVRLIQDQAQPIAPVPQPVEPRVATPPVAGDISNLFGPTGPSLLSELRRNRTLAPGSDVVQGSEGRFRATTDAGNLLGKSIQTRGVTPQNRTPIITDTRVRGQGVGNLLASGSYWVPARPDLDTMLSKIDSRIVGDVTVIKGPYSALYGPGTSFVDVNLLGSPRYEEPEIHATTSLEYKTNGDQWYGRETIYGGDEDWGFRFGYGNRTGSDYTMGNGQKLPSSYHSQDFDVALGYDFSEDSHIEFSYLRLDQTDVESPGQFFDFNYLVTDAFEVTYTLENQEFFDTFTTEVWYNRTRFDGDASRPGKRAQIPSIPLVSNNLATNVDSMSTGYTSALTWGQRGEAQLTAGTDLRYLKQELNEINDFQVDVDAVLAATLGIAPGLYVFNNANSPTPRSHWANPGVFAEFSAPATDRLTVRTGARADWLSTNVERDPPGLSSTLPTQVPLTRDFIQSQLRTNSLDREFDLWSFFGSADFKLNDEWTLGGAAGVGMRAPTLTELYATGAFLSVVQNGFNSVIGDPNLDPSRQTQIDISLKVDDGRFRGGLTGFHAWIKDFITYEVVLFNALPEENTRGLTYVNTPRATLAGFESYAEYDVNDWLTPFGTVAFVEGRDHTRSAGGQQFYNPAFAQILYDPAAPRGILPGGEEEPLPSIPPLQARLGLRVHEPGANPDWGMELSARIVDAQNRVATSIGELPTGGYTTFDARGFWRANKHLTMVGGVENFTNKFYREHLDLRTGRGVFQPGINFYFGSQLGW